MEQVQVPRKWMVIGMPQNLWVIVKIEILLKATAGLRIGAHTTVQSVCASRNVANLLSNSPRTKNCTSPVAAQGPSCSLTMLHKSIIEDATGALNWCKLTWFARLHWQSNGLSRKESWALLGPVEGHITMTESSNFSGAWGDGMSSQHSWRARRSSATRS